MIKAQFNDRCCIICGDKFNKKVHNQTTCSKECRKKLKLINAKTYYISNAKKIIERVSNYKPYIHICIECWNEFNSTKKIAKFCSKKCEAKANKIIRLWKNNPWYRNWEYIKENIWSSKINHKQRLFMKQCKILDEQIINDIWYIYCQSCWVSVSAKFEHHHIVYRSEKPRHKYLHDLRNIILCCMECHNNFHKSKWNRNELVKERKLHELFWNDILNK
jgi:arginine/lysine/ornithine decarboxylase